MAWCSREQSIRKYPLPTGPLLKSDQVKPLKDLETRGPDRHRELAAPLQRSSAAHFDRLPRSRSRSVRARARRMAGYATQSSSAADASAGANTSPKLTSYADHSAGAGQGQLQNKVSCTGISGLMYQRHHE